MFRAIYLSPAALPFTVVLTFWTPVIVPWFAITLYLISLSRYLVV
jgi:hypothetical protein